LTKEVLIKVRELTKLFPVRKGFINTILSREDINVHAVDGVSFDIIEEEPTSGDVYYKDTNITDLKQSEVREIRKKMQIIFQDPYESLNPRMTILDLVGEPLEIHDRIENEEDKIKQVSEILELVKLTPADDYLFRYPHELSGGQRQRIAIFNHSP